MADSQPSFSSMKGKVDGKPVTFSYESSERTAGVLSWTLEDEISSGPVHQSVSRQHIIGIIKSSIKGNDSNSILFVNKSTIAGDDSLASPPTLGSIDTVDLPEALVHDIQPHGPSEWWIQHQTERHKPELHVLVSCGSGTGQAESIYESLVKPMFDHAGILQGRDYVLHLTTSDTSVLELAEDCFLPQANKGIPQVIVLLSGDGGMVDMVNAILSAARSEQYCRPIVALMPLGTGNALANSAGLTNDDTIGLRTLMQGAPQELPLFRASFSPGARLLVNEGRDERKLHILNGTPIAHGAVVASWGLHAALVADSDTTEYRKFGAERFKMAGKEALFPSDGSMPHAYKGDISVLRKTAHGEERWQSLDRSEHGYVLATLVAQLEKGFTISPSSQALTGKLHLVDFGPVSGQEAMDVMMQAYDGGKHIGNERVRYQEVEGFRIQFNEQDGRWRRICIDGKIIRVEEGGWIEVRGGIKGVVDLLVPK